MTRSYLMTETCVCATDKQKKVAREVKNELFSVTPAGGGDDTAMGSFINYVLLLKNDLEKLEIHHENQPLYPANIRSWMTRS